MSIRNWRYKLEESFHHADSNLKGIYFENEWLVIRDGLLTISAGYSWDGCSPAYRVPFTNYWVGIPQGYELPIGVPQAYFPSLVHDVLCQFSADIALTRKEATDIFRDMLQAYEFTKFRANIYAAAVKLFGPQNWAGDLV